MQKLSLSLVQIEDGRSNFGCRAVDTITFTHLRFLTYTILSIYEKKYPKPSKSIIYIIYKHINIYIYLHIYIYIYLHIYIYI